MNISVSHVPEEGMTQHAAYDPSSLDMERDDVHLREPFEADAAITKSQSELIVNTQIRCPAVMTCARCLEEFTVTLRPRALLTYHVAPTDVVDITDDIRQEIILAYPMIPVCRPDCQGLCSVCGQNLNEASCPHQEARSA